MPCVLQRPAWPSREAGPTNSSHTNNTSSRNTPWPNGCRRARAGHQFRQWIIWSNFRRIWDVASDSGRWAQAASKRVREPEESEPIENKVSEKKKKKTNTADEEYESCVADIKNCGGIRILQLHKYLGSTQSVCQYGGWACCKHNGGSGRLNQTGGRHAE